MIIYIHLLQVEHLQNKINMNGRLIINNNLIFDSNRLILLSGFTSATITTSSISSIGQNTATGGGNVTSSGDFIIIVRGVCWNTSTNPTISNSHTSDGSGAGSFSSTLSSLSPITGYYVRAYATNSIGETIYGNNVTFTTEAVPPPCQDFTIGRFSNSYFRITTSSSQFANYNGITWYYRPPGGQWTVGYSGGSDYTVYSWELVKATHNGTGLLNGGLCNFTSNTIYAP